MSEKQLPRNVEPLENIAEALAASHSLSASGARTVPGVAFWQGPRLMFISAVGFTTIASSLQAKSVNPKDLKDVEANPMDLVRFAFNRAKDPNHIKNIAEYLEKEHTFILPALIVNVPPTGNGVRLLCAGNPTRSPQTLAWLVVDDNFEVVPTDGQHRGDGIKLALDKRHDLRGSSVGIMVSFEQDPDQVHQDFADCAQTKQISPSLMQVYNRRAASGRFVETLIDRCDLFANGKVDPEGKSMSKGSIKVFLHAHVVSFVKALVIGRKASMHDFEETLSAKLHDDPEFVDRVVGYVNDMTAVVRPLSRLSRLALADRDKVPEIREEGWLPMTSSGLGILGTIGRRLLQLTPAEYNAAIRRLGEIDWSYMGPLWEENVCVARFKDPDTGRVRVLKVQTGSQSVQLAADAALDYILPKRAAAA